MRKTATCLVGKWVQELITFLRGCRVDAATTLRRQLIRSLHMRSSSGSPLVRFSHAERHTSRSVIFIFAGKSQKLKWFYAQMSTEALVFMSCLQPWASGGKSSFTKWEQFYWPWRDDWLSEPPNQDFNSQPSDCARFARPLTHLANGTILVVYHCWERDCVVD